MNPKLRNVADNNNNNNNMGGNVLVAKRTELSCLKFAHRQRTGWPKK